VGYIIKKYKKRMENKLLSFSEFETLYESYGFVNEAEEPKPMFTPQKTQVTKDDLASLFTEQKIEEAVSEFSAIMKGEKSDRVKNLQKDLGITDDGVFGPGTEKAVKEFQTKNKIKVDGKVGVQTLRKMLELKGDKNPDETIKTRYIVKVQNAKEAVKEAINPDLLKLYDITIVNNGKQQYVILIPKKEASETSKTLKAKDGFKGFEWMLEGLKYVGKALVYTATGITVVTLEMAKAMVAGIASAIKFVGEGTMYVMGATIQGIVNIAKWAKAKGVQAYNKVASTSNALWEGFCKGFASAAKSSVQAFVAFMSIVKAIGYTLTGIAITAWKNVANTLDPAVKVIVQGAKNAEAFISSGMEWIKKNVKNGLVTMKNSVAAGFESVKKATQNAWEGAKSATKSAGDAVYKAASQAYTSVNAWFSEMYNIGKKAWESLSDILGEDPIFESEGWEEIEFSISE